METRLTRMQHFATPALASEAAATHLATAVAQRLNHEARASLVVSGGNTPADCLEQLSGAGLEWQRVDILLTDERMVDPEDERSNEKMVRARLLQRKAALSRFHRLYEGPVPNVMRPFAATLVGMGNDGHFASIFPDIGELPMLLDANAEPGVHHVATGASEVDRLTLNFAALLESGDIALLAFGDSKRTIIDSSAGYPIDSLLTQTRTPVTVFWAPSEE